ncbi:hypothetical protein B0A75_05020 [Flavobacterium oncorhynchi]|uniref:THIF-type NAD/FAD binding fold domain-containing protein n=1 Tax=Flavobacterium oncorhynchi TaxID=728056 RepID=A0A226I680_9FLAO|nr:ThiF family adenylyltransferase [Flavobacterium oncorhynchi]OXB01805.1 hypothetical protein B0A75_05020 [Flavobacterium oncorhynchi]
MEERLSAIINIFQQFDDLKIIKNFEIIDSYISGKIEISCLQKPNIIFDVKISNNYPLKSGTVESISFINKNLKKYSHINFDGSVCFHNPTHPDLEYKLEFDIKALLEWVDKYYIKELNDGHFEYLFYKNQDSNQVFLFSDPDNSITREDFGFMFFNKHSTFNDKNTFLIQGLKSQTGRNNIIFGWSKYYSGFKGANKGLYYIAEKPPVYYRNFAYEKWSDFKTILSNEFFKFLNDSKRHIERKHLLDNKYLILLYGYPIDNEKMHFETLKIDYYNIPIFKNEISDDYITWCKTVDSSYELFFGRGKLNDNLTEKKILIIGIGAVGSSLSESLVRGGCKYVDILDYDIKEIGNICRAKYNFMHGERPKVDELKFSLIAISPFVNVESYNLPLLPLQTLPDLKKNYADYLDKYDFIFNCSASNDVNIILDQLEIKNKTIVSISISNHANDLVCIIGNENIYNSNSEIFQEINQDLIDMFNPQGCWNPTFKASYHNINALVNYALSNIDYRLKKGLALKTFLLQVAEESNYKINLKD